MEEHFCLENWKIKISRAGNFCFLAREKKNNPYAAFLVWLVRDGEELKRADYGSKVGVVQLVIFMFQ